MSTMGERKAPEIIPPLVVSSISMSGVILFINSPLVWIKPSVSPVAAMKTFTHTPAMSK